MNVRLSQWLFLVAALGVFAGCADPRRSAAADVIAGNVPDGLRLKMIDDRYAVQTQPDGSRIAEVPVYYEVTSDRYRVERFTSTTLGKTIAPRIDDVTNWATSELREDDASRIEILRLRSEIPTDLIFFDRVMQAEQEIASVVSIVWPSGSQPASAIITGGIPKVRGTEVEDLNVGVIVGSPAATAAMASVRDLISQMDTTRTRWKETRDERTTAARAQWTDLLVAGADFREAGDDDAKRLLFTDGIGPNDEARWILTSGETPLQTYRMTARLAPVYAGGLELRVVAAEKILTADRESGNAVQIASELAGSTLSATDENGLRLRTPDEDETEFRPQGIVDMLPPEEG